MKTYTIKECFYSPQGEGHRMGTMNVFLRFAGCNIQCVDQDKLDRPLKGNEHNAGFFCDTDFASGEKLTVEEVIGLVRATDEGSCGKIILTGGEPTLQVDEMLLTFLKRDNRFVAIETNGTRNPEWLRNKRLVDWISCSPKPGSGVVIPYADEVRCVVKPGQVPDTMGVQSLHKFVSPACDAPTADKIPGWHAGPKDLNQEAIAWAVDWCRKNPEWRVSLQMHKILNCR